MLSLFTKKLCFLPYSRICSKLLANTVMEEQNIAWLVSTNKPFFTDVPNLTSSQSQGGDSDTLKEKATRKQNKAEKQKVMVNDVYYKQTSGAKLKNLDVRDCKEHLLKDTDESTTHSHIDELESEEMDFSEDARLLLKAIKFVGPKAGLSMSFLLLTGSESKRLWPRMKKSNLYGSGKDKTKDYWEALTGSLVANKYLVKTIQLGVTNQVFHGYKVSRLGMKLLTEKNSVLKMRPNRLLSMPYSTRKEIIYYDLETTGINAYNKHKGVEILEIGAISNSHGKIFQQYILPTKPIAPEATNVHGLFMKEKDGSSELDWNSLYINEDGEARKVDAVDKVTGFNRFITWMETFESKLTLAGYNSHNYDDWVLCHEMQGLVEKEQVGIHTFADVSKIVRPILEAKRIRKWNLGLAVAHFLKREQDRAHGAVSDVKDCRDLLVKIGEMQNKTVEEVLVGNRYARKGFEEVWVVCSNMANPNGAKVSRLEDDEYDVPLQSTVGMPLIREMEDFSMGYDSDLKETANSDQHLAELQESMIDDSYYDQFANFGGADSNEFVQNENVEESPIDSNFHEEEEGVEMDFSEDARLLLNAIKFVGPKAGIGMSCCLLTGAEDKRLWPKMKKSAWYGRGKDKSKDYWMALTGALLMNMYLDEISHVGVYKWNYNGYKVNSLGLKVLKDKDFVVKMKQTKELKRATEGKRVSQNRQNESSTSVPNFAMNKERTVIPYHIQQTFTMFEQCKDVDEVAKMKGIKRSTVMGYLATALELGAPVDICDLNVSESVQEDVSRIIRKKSINGDVSKLKPIKTELEMVGSDVGYDQIKLVIAKLKLDHGVSQLGILQWTHSEEGRNLTEEGNSL